MTSSYKDKVIKAVEFAENLDQLQYIEDKLTVTKEINRRTKKGRELTVELKQIINDKAQLLIKNGELPF